MWRMVVAAPAVPCWFPSSSYALLDTLPPARLRQEWCEVVYPSCRLEEVRRTFQHEEVGLGEDEGMDNGGSCSCCALSSFLQLICPPGCVQSWLVTSVNSKTSSRARMLLPPPASDDYSFWEHRCGIQ